MHSYEIDEQLMTLPAAIAYQKAGCERLTLLQVSPHMWCCDSWNNHQIWNWAVNCQHSSYRMQWTEEGSVFATVSLWFFVCVWNISWTAEWTCTKFTWKSCLVPHLDMFEGQGQRSRLPGQKQHFLALLAACMWFVFGKTSLASSICS